MKIEKININQIKPYWNNPRKNSGKMKNTRIKGSEIQKIIFVDCCTTLFNPAMSSLANISANFGEAILLMDINATAANIESLNAVK